MITETKKYVCLFYSEIKLDLNKCIFYPLQKFYTFISWIIYSDCAEKKVASQADDETTAKWLWLVSQKWTRLEKTI